MKKFVAVKSIDHAPIVGTRAAGVAKQAAHKYDLPVSALDISNWRTIHSVDGDGYVWDERQAVRIHAVDG